MKKVLSLLLAFLILQVQTWALSGGPVFETFNSASVIGTYAGVMLPEGLDSSGETTEGSATAIGLFSFGVPETGVATGAAVVFIEGTAFNGQITGVADPQNGSFHGIVDAISTYEVVDPAFPDANFRVFAQGNIDAQLEQSGATAQFGLGFTGLRIAGTAVIDVFGSLEADNTPAVTNTARFTVDGFKQSDTVVAASFVIGQ